MHAGGDERARRVGNRAADDVDHGAGRTASRSASRSCCANRGGSAASGRAPRGPGERFAGAVGDQRDRLAVFRRRARPTPVPPTRTRCARDRAVRRRPPRGGRHRRCVEDARETGGQRARRRCPRAARVRSRSRRSPTCATVAPGAARGGSVPPPENHTLFTLARPARSRSTLTGCSCSSIWISVCQRRHGAGVGSFGQQRAQRHGPRAASSGMRRASAARDGARTNQASGRGATNTRPSAAKCG